MTKIILITSGKGGTGKTTLSCNLAYALSELNKKVFVIDTNLTTPNVGFQFGFSLVNSSLHDFLSGRQTLENVIYTHKSGVKVLPGSLRLEDINDVDGEKLLEAIIRLLPVADYIILDGAAGIGRETLNALNICNDVIIVTNPELPAVIDSLRVIEVAKKLKKNIIGVVVNRVGARKSELPLYEIQNILGEKIIGTIPEDKNVGMSIDKRKILMEYAPYSPAATEIRKIAYSFEGKTYKFIPQSLFYKIRKFLGF